MASTSISVALFKEAVDQHRLALRPRRTRRRRSGRAAACRSRSPSPGRRARSSAAPAPGSRSSLGDVARLGRGAGDAAGRLAQAESVDQRGELLAVLGRLDRVDRRTDDRQARVLDRARARLSGVCPPNWSDDAVRADALADVQHVFDRQRLEEQEVARVVVGAHRLGVRVDHHRLDAHLTQREAGVAAAVVELDPLADPVWPAAEDDDPLLVALLAGASSSTPK